MSGSPCLFATVIIPWSSCDFSSVRENIARENATDNDGGGVGCGGVGGDDDESQSKM